MVKIESEKINNDSYEKYPVMEVMIKNQKVKPAVTVIDLNRGDDNFNFKLDR